MTLGFRTALMLVSLFVTTPVLAMGNKPDCSASFEAAKAAVPLTCDCQAATSHGQFVRCGVRVVKGLAQTGMVDKRCKGEMVRVLAKSTCGRDGAVTCCVSRGPLKACLVKKAPVCDKLGGTVGVTPMCADACGSPSGAFLD